MNAKKIMLFAVGLLMAFSVMAKPSVSKVSAKVNGANLDIAFTLSEKGYNPETCWREASIMLFASQADATSYFKDEESAVEVLAEFCVDEVDEEELGNKTYKLSYCIEGEIGVSPKEMKAEWPNAYAVVVLFEECEKNDDYVEYYVTAGSKVDYSAMSGAPQIALQLYKKAQTLNGVSMNMGEDFTGTVALKLGAINKKTGAVKVSATITPFSGKKLTASQTVTAEEDGCLYGVLKFKGVESELYFWVGLDAEAYEEDASYVTPSMLTFSGESEDLFIYKAQVGGVLDAEALSFSEDREEDFDFGDDYEDLGITADGEMIFVTKGTKWSFAKSPTIKYKKYREDGEVWYELDGLDDEVKTNQSGLKLTYTSKTGVFKGSYYIYTSNECCIDYGRQPKLKKYKVTVSGVMIDGCGYGSASVKIGKTTYTWKVYVE